MVCRIDVCAVVEQCCCTGDIALLCGIVQLPHGWLGLLKRRFINFFYDEVVTFAKVFQQCGRLKAAK